jgi:hypothetical protein
MAFLAVAGRAKPGGARDVFSISFRNSYSVDLFAEEVILMNG